MYYLIASTWSCIHTYHIPGRSKMLISAPFHNQLTDEKAREISGKGRCLATRIILLCVCQNMRLSEGKVNLKQRTETLTAHLPLFKTSTPSRSTRFVGYIALRILQFVRNPSLFGEKIEHVRKLALFDVIGLWGHTVVCVGWYSVW